MVKIRHSMFETNSSSSDALIIQMHNYDIPKTIELKSDDKTIHNHKVDGASEVYQSLKNENLESQLFSYLKSRGVINIYVDGVLVKDIPEFDGDMSQLTKNKEYFDARLFGKQFYVSIPYKSNSEDFDYSDDSWLVDEYEDDPDYKIIWYS